MWNPRPLRFSAKFSSRSFIHFELIAAYCFKLGRFSIFGLLLSICFSTICWKDDHFLIELSCHLCQKSIAYLYLDLFLGTLFFSTCWLVYMFTFMPVPPDFVYCSSVMSLETDSISLTTLFLPTYSFIVFQICFSYSKFFHFHLNFRVNLFISTKKPSGIYIGIMFNLCFTLGNWCLTVLTVLTV